MAEETDEQVAARVQAGQAHAFSELVRRYEEKITRYARRFLFGSEEVKDAVQEIFLKAYINIQSFDTSRRFSPWIYRIAHNECVNIGYSLKRLPFFTFDLDVLLPHRASPDRVETALERKEIAALVEESLKELPVKYREPLSLYYLEEMSYQEISDILHIPVSTVGVRILRGKKQLKRILKDHV